MTISTAFFEDRSRWFLWWPVGMGIGIVFYFSLFHEPSTAQVLVLLLMSLGGACATHFFWRDHVLFFLISMTIFSLTLGFAAAKIRTDQLATPFLFAKIEEVKVTARIADIEEQPTRRRLILDDLTFPEKVPPLHKIRLTLPLSRSLIATIGDRVSFHASLLPLSDPVSLNGYNFRRQAYFQGIGATGRIKSSLHVIKSQDKQLWLATTRYHLTQTIRQRFA